MKNNRKKIQVFLNTSLLFAILSLILVSSVFPSQVLANEPALIAEEKQWLSDNPVIKLIGDPDWSSQEDLYFNNISLKEKINEKERAWLSKHPKIIVGGEIDWAPFDFVDETGAHSGISNDYIKVIAEALGLEIEIITDSSWNNLLEMMKNKQIDVLPAIYYDNAREEFLNYTTSYARVTEFIYVRDETDWVFELDDLVGKKVVVVKGYTVEDILRDKYPDIQLITADNIKESLKKLILGEADAFIGDIASTSYNIRTYSMTGVKPVAPGPFTEPTVHIGVRKDWPELRSLINKVLSSMPEAQKDLISTRWFTQVSMSKLKTNRLDNLTDKEKTWIKNNPIIRVHNETDWAPFNFNDNGKPKGLSIDYMNLLASKVGLQVEYISGPTWNGFMEMIKAGELDVMP